MPASVKRYGLESVDLETELRFRRIEGVLEKQAGAGDYGDSPFTQRVSSIPKVTGLRLVGSTPGAATVAWNQVRITDLRRYELQVAEDFAFSSNKQEFNLAATQYQFSTISPDGGGGATVIYTRVRARNKTGNVGEWSAVLNTVTGQAQTEDIADEAITEEKVSEEAQEGLLGQLVGLQISNNALNPSSRIDFSSGVTRDSTNVLSMRLISATTKATDTTWEVGLGGMAEGVTLAASLPYFVFVISNADGSTVNVGFDSDPSAANLGADTNVIAAGLTRYRRVGFFLTDGSAEILPFHQHGDLFQLDTPVQDPASYTASAPAKNVEITHTLTYAPVGIQCRVQMSIVWYTSDTDNWTGLVAYASSYCSSLTTVNGADGGTTGDSRNIEIAADLLLPAEATFKTYQSNTTGAVRLYFQTHSFVDRRGKDGEI